VKDIITSLFIYKSQLYTSSLDGNISQTDIETKYISDEKVEFSLNKYFSETIILDIKAYKNKFYILTRDGLYKYFDSNIEKIKSIDDAQVITIDGELKTLFIVSDSRGLVGINLNTDNYIDDININIFSNSDKQTPITSITANNGIIFLSILNAGIFRIDYKSKQSEFVYKKMQKIELQNPQDIYHNEKDNELAIVDFDYGLIIINLSNGVAIGYRLPNDDVPNSLKFVNNFGNKFYIVQARKALYKFDVSNKEFIQLLNQQVSNLTTYYDKAYFTHQGKLRILNV